MHFGEQKSYLWITQLSKQRSRYRQRKVSSEDTAFLPPNTVDRRFGPAQLGLVNDVIMIERTCVEHLTYQTDVTLERLNLRGAHLKSWVLEDGEVWGVRSSYLEVNIASLRHHPRYPRPDSLPRSVKVISGYCLHMQIQATGFIPHWDIYLERMHLCVKGPDELFRIFFAGFTGKFPWEKSVNIPELQHVDLNLSREMTGRAAGAISSGGVSTPTRLALRLERRTGCTQ